MKFLKSILAGFSKAIKAIANLFKGESSDGKSTGTTVDEVVETITAVGTIAIGAHMAFRKLKAEFSPEPALAGGPNMYAASDIGKSKYVKVVTPSKGKKVKVPEKLYDQNSNALLEKISATRNDAFRRLNPDQKVRVLKAEGFSVKAFLINQKRGGVLNDAISDDDRKRVNFSAPDGVWKTSFERMVSSPKNLIRKMFGKPASITDKDLFIYKPLSTDYLPDLPFETMDDLARYSDLLAKYDFLQTGDIDVWITEIPTTPSGMSLEEQRIRQEEAAQHSTYKKYEKAVRLRMKTEGVTPSIAEMMGGKKKNKKDGKKKKSGDSEFERGFFSMFDDDEIDHSDDLLSTGRGKSKKSDKLEDKVRDKMRAEFAGEFNRDLENIRKGNVFQYSASNPNGGGKKKRR